MTVIGAGGVTMHVIGKLRSGRLAVLGVAFVFMAALVGPGVARAEGALVVGKPDNVAQDGIAFGYANNKSTKDEAIKRAFELCRTAPSSDLAHARCTLVRSYHRECVAIAMDPKAGTPGAGWAIATTMTDAEQSAMENCETTAGPDRQGKCVLSASHCDGTPGD